MLCIAFLAFTFQAGEWVSIQPAFLTLHTIFEVASVVVSVLVFSVVWNTRKFTKNSNLLVMACLMLMVAALDFCHTFSYAGMPDFVTPSSPEKAISFWLAARAAGTVGLLILALQPWWQLPKLNSYQVLLWVSLLTLAVIYTVLFQAHLIPETFTPDTGLTPFKKGFEYSLITLNAVAAWLFFRTLKNKKAGTNTSALLNVALIVVVSEYFFTLYADVTDIYNLFGHVFKVFAYFFLYRAIYVETVVFPYLSLAEAKQQLSTTISMLPDSIFEITKHGKIVKVYANPDPRSLIPHNPVGQNLFSVLSVEARNLVEQAMQQATASGRSERRIFELSDDYFVEASLALNKNASGEQLTYLVVSRDVSDRVKQVEEIRTLSMAVDQSPIPILITNTKAEIEYVNQAYQTFSGYSTHELLGKNPNIVASTKNNRAVYEEMWQNLTRNETWQGDLINIGKQGKEVIQRATIFPILNEQGLTYKYISFQPDVTELRESQARVDQLFYYDDVTKLPNHNAFEAAYNNLKDLKGAVFYIDLDNFKLVNDGLGIDAGKQVLLKLGEAVSNVITKHGRAFRLSGDVFACLAPATPANEAAQLAGALLTAIRRPVQINQEIVVVTASIGIHIYHQKSDSAEDTLGAAEAAMYHAKQSGRNNFQFFEPRLQQEASRQLQVLNALNFAIENNEFHLVFQPQVSVHKSAPFGAEVLIRWESSSLGIIPPDEFIPLAEMGGLIGDIDRWVFLHAVEQLHQWKADGLKDFQLSINLSAVQFEDPDLVDKLVSTLEPLNVLPSEIELELTETVAMKNPESGLHTIQALRAAGFKIALDDFGTGHSSISYLQRFGVDKLKIDRAFVSNLHRSKKSTSIVKSIIDLAHGLDIQTIAEGVELKEELNKLAELHCDEIQGYYFSKPLTAQNLRAFIDAQQNHPH
ncbi:EAL domain-containing protein [Aliidiomarina celeris]|uniref:EAL domain-containing protein n=1 Tax=Aliidiomarina celeris TaxID=2249428 RepID=UPI000DE9FA24|nr:EAL domain-containing protein [Aliidiomarina celeris]